MWRRGCAVNSTCGGGTVGVMACGDGMACRVLEAADSAGSEVDGHRCPGGPPRGAMAPRGVREKACRHGAEVDRGHGSHRRPISVARRRPRPRADRRLVAPACAGSAAGAAPAGSPITRARRLRDLARSRADRPFRTTRRGQDHLGRRLGQQGRGSLGPGEGALHSNRPACAGQHPPGEAGRKSPSFSAKPSRNMQATVRASSFRTRRRRSRRIGGA